MHVSPDGCELNLSRTLPAPGRPDKVSRVLLVGPLLDLGEHRALGDGGDGFSVHTRWIETEWNNTIEPFTGGEPLDEDDARPRQKVVVEVGGRRLEVSLPGDLALGNGSAADPAGVIRKKPKPRKRGSHAGAAASGDAVTAPMQGTVVKVAVEEGQEVAAGDLVVVLEAMKMENPVTAHKDGTITGLAVEPGAAITQGTVLAEIT